MPFPWNPPRPFCSFLAAASLLLAPGLGAHAHAESSTSAQASDARSAIQQTHIVKRQNLQPVSYAANRASRGQLRVGIRHPGQNGSDIVVNRPAPDDDLAPLTDLASLRAEVAFVQDLETQHVLYDKNSDAIRPIASISKLMTALVVTESGLPMDEVLTISDADVDRMRYSRSRLPVGTELTRGEMLHLALMSSENRAAHALGRYYPGGMPAFVRAMNDKARALGMRNTHFIEPTGLSSENVSTSRDLVKLLQATREQKLIHRYSTDDKHEFTVSRGRQLAYRNTNRLVRNAKWDIQVSKTGFINEAGECLVMLTRIDNRDVAIVLLNASNHTRIGDAVRIRTLLVENESKLALL
ncbi:D-alanyl-D-alanine endopeptidase [Pusillimonas sp. MFBS29]|uniref:D-alanyl-D-alanine endopeptidase n=1 Tax=Pusillimonas sp. MFBS29 TaxID=2886690 RepID=UPI001D12DFF1|nr:D-alanyl-D-alanine endopeptidase [Pusillimonas sp. MFBS29]MCC2595648.1 D-alanyl-D-alanine endopeptidase [Pusillimonas sp. MFBS29]